MARKAYRIRPEPVLADEARIRVGALPSMATLCRELETWLPLVGLGKAPSDLYREFLIRQLENAQSGDITARDFYSIFYVPDRK